MNWMLPTLWHKTEETRISVIEHSTKIESDCTERADLLFKLVSKTRLGYKENTEMYEKLKANNVGYCNNRQDRKVWRNGWRQYEMNEEDKDQDAGGDNRKRTLRWTHLSYYLMSEDN